MKGKQIQWFVPAEDVFRITQDERNPKSFRITFLHHYSFEAESSDQVQQLRKNDHKKQQYDFSYDLKNEAKSLLKQPSSLRQVAW